MAASAGAPALPSASSAVGAPPPAGVAQPSQLDQPSPLAAASVRPNAQPNAQPNATRARGVRGWIERHRGQAWFDFARVVVAVTVVGVTFGGLRLSAAREPSGGLFDDEPVEVATPRARRGTSTPTPATTSAAGSDIERGSFAATYPVPPRDVLRGKGVSTAAEPECPGTGRRICLVSVGSAPAVDVEGVAAYLRATYDVPVAVVPAINLTGIEEFDGQVANQERHQLRGTQVLEVLRRRFPHATRDADVTLLAITAHDLYEEFTGTAYQYAVRTGAPGRMAVVSNARMDDRAWGQPPNPEALLTRTRKLVARELGALHFGLAITSEAGSAMNGAFGSRAGVDRAADHLDLPPTSRP